MKTNPKIPNLAYYIILALCLTLLAISCAHDPTTQQKIQKALDAATSAIPGVRHAIDGVAPQWTQPLLAVVNALLVIWNTLLSRRVRKLENGNPP